MGRAGAAAARGAVLAGARDPEPRRDRRRVAGRGRGRSDRLLPGARAVRQHGAGRCAGAGAGGARAAAAAGFCQSLKEDEAAALLADVFEAHPPAVILNATGFSLAASGGGDPLRADCPVLQIVFSGGDEDSWRAGTRGLGPRDLAMNVALPEIDGRILSRAVSFKAPLGRDPETEADLVGYRPVADRVAFVADLARNWARLRARSRRSGGSRSCSRTTRTATAASATGSGSTRRHRRSRS